MKVEATYRHVFEVTRPVEIDDEVFQSWHSRELDRGRIYPDGESTLCAFLNTEDSEFLAEVFRDWRINAPLPGDFELQWSEAIHAAPATREGNRNG